MSYVWITVGVIWLLALLMNRKVKWEQKQEEDRLKERQDRAEYFQKNYNINKNRNGF